MNIEEVIARAIYGETDKLAIEVGSEVLAALKAVGLETEWVDADANVYPVLVLKLGPSKGSAYVRREKRLGLLRQAMQRLRLTGKELDKDLADEIQSELDAP